MTNAEDAAATPSGTIGEIRGHLNAAMSALDDLQRLLTAAPEPPEDPAANGGERR